MSRQSPILFRGEMVRAILEGRKTQTRRIVKPQPEFRGSGNSWHWKGGKKLRQANYGADYVHTDRCALRRAMTSICPYGQAGDRLWVREAWNIYDAEGELYDCRHGIPSECPPGYHVSYPADDPDGVIEQVFRWRPSIHMPRWASRITLEITAVDVQQLAEINTHDAIAEGCVSREAFMHLWRETHGVWNATLWVWIVEFKQVQNNRPSEGSVPPEHKQQGRVRDTAIRQPLKPER